MLSHHSGGDPAALIASLLSMPSHSAVLERVTQLININIVRNISSSIRIMSNTPQTYLLLTRRHCILSSDTRSQWVFHLSKSAYHNARSHVHKAGVGIFPHIVTPQSKQTTSATAIDSIRTFLTEHSQPAANRTIIDQHKQHVPARTLNATTAELWRKYIANTTDKQLHVSRCQFYKIVARLKIFKHATTRHGYVWDMCRWTVHSTITRTITLTTSSTLSTRYGHSTICHHDTGQHRRNSTDRIVIVLHVEYILTPSINIYCHTYIIDYSSTSNMHYSNTKSSISNH